VTINDYHLDNDFLPINGIQRSHVFFKAILMRRRLKITPKKGRIQALFFQVKKNY